MKSKRSPIRHPRTFFLGGLAFIAGAVRIALHLWDAQNQLPGDRGRNLAWGLLLLVFGALLFWASTVELRPSSSDHSAPQKPR